MYMYNTGSKLRYYFHWLYIIMIILKYGNITSISATTQVRLAKNVIVI